MRFLSSKVHTIIGIIVGIALLFAPQIFGFSDNVAASMVPLYVGIFIIINELITTSRLSLFKLVPMKVHLVIDYVTGIFLALSPWLFGFSTAPANAWVPHLIVGILIVGYALVTNPTVDTVEENSPVVQ
jgi:hypothetical protein